MRMSKLRCIVLLASLLFSSFLYAQAGKLPFQMVQANGKVFKAQDLQIGKAIVIIYFS